MEGYAPTKTKNWHDSALLQDDWCNYLKVQKQELSFNFNTSGYMIVLESFKIIEENQLATILNKKICATRTQ